MAANEPAREWLRANGYGEVAGMIDEIMAEWKSQGKATRRNWWEVLAGDRRGEPRRIAGRTFPILRAAQKRQSLPNTETAQNKVPSEIAPKISPSPRWKTHRKRKNVIKRRARGAKA